MTASVESLSGAARTGALIDAWAAAMADVRAVAAAAGETGWRQPSLLPGWSVADVVAHLAWIERGLLGLADPPHEPDWSTLPHVGGGLSRITEVPVDLRRSWSRAAVLAEFDDAVVQRQAALRDGPQDPATPAVNPFGRMVTLEAVLRMRTFDAWVHSQDVRLALGTPGSTDTAAAGIAGAQIASGLGKVWAKAVDAPAGSTLRVDVTPPGVALVAAVLRGDDGKGVFVDPPDQPTVRLTLAFDDFVQLGCGRERPDSTTGQARSRVLIDGEAELGARAVAALNIAP